MVVLGQMQKALIEAGLVETPKDKRKRQGKQFKCKKCGKTMVKHEDTNVISCPECDRSFFLFTR